MSVPGMTHEEGTRLKRYVQRECFWLDVRVWGSATGTVVVMRLPWPQGHTETLSEFRRGAADAAMDRLCAISDAYWQQVVPERKQA